MKDALCTSTVVPTVTVTNGTASGTSSSTGTPAVSNVCLPSTNGASGHRHKEEADTVKQFLSLPRRTRGSRSYSSLNRGLATSTTTYLSRSDEKRRSDSMLFQKVLLPLPACDRSSHLRCGSHLLFEALRNPTCRLTQLNLSKSSITVADSMCLGNGIIINNNNK